MHIFNEARKTCRLNNSYQRYQKDNDNYPKQQHFFKLNSDW